MGFVRALLVLASSAIVGCAAEAPPEDVGVVEEAITNGTVDDSDSAVVALLHAGEVYCSGVLVGPYAVATAGHCVSDVKPDQIFFGSDPKNKDDGTFVDVVDTKLHSGFDPDTLENDVAVVGLKEAAPVKPVKLVDAGSIDTSWVGKELKIVGFGLTKSTDGDTGPKRVGQTKIDSLDDATFRFEGEPSQTCSGDSGGPAFAKVDGENRLVGITSSGDSDCKVYGRDTRVDTNIDFISSYSTAYDDLAVSPITSAGCSTSGRGKTGGLGVLILAAAVALGVRRRRRQGQA